MPLVAVSALEQFTAVNLRLDAGAIGGPVVIPQCAQISLVWNQESGKVAHNVLYGRYSGAFAGTVAQANSILTALNTGGAWSALAAVLSNTGGLQGVVIRDVNTANQALIASTAPGALGLSTTGALPNEVAAVITTRTAFTGRANRGRIYIPNFAVVALATGNVISAAAVTALNNWAQTIPTAFSAQGYTLVLGQRQRQAYTGSTGTQHPARQATSTPITQLVVRDNHWDTQRRRGLK